MAVWKFLESVLMSWGFHITLYSPCQAPCWAVCESGAIFGADIKMSDNFCPTQWLDKELGDDMRTMICMRMKRPHKLDEKGGEIDKLVLHLWSSCFFEFFSISLFSLWLRPALEKYLVTCSNLTPFLFCYLYSFCLTIFQFPPWYYLCYRTSWGEGSVLTPRDHRGTAGAH